MILNSIELKNIRSYNSEKIEFPRGITLFEGDIGSGKSSVLMGIEFALFGLGSQKPESLLSKKEVEGHVTLKFEADGKRYEIKRTLKRKNDAVSQDSRSCHLITDDLKEPLSASELKQRVLQILKFNEPQSANSESRIYRYAVFTPQEEMKQILRDSSKRLETIRKAFGMEDYKVATENAKNLASTLKTKIAVYKDRFSNLDELKTDFNKITKEQKKESQEISEIIEQLKELEKIQISHQKTVEQAREKQKEHYKLTLEQGGIRQDIDDNQSTLESLEEEVTDKESEIQQITRNIKKLQAITSPTSKALSQIEDEISIFERLHGEIIETSSTIKSLSDELSKIYKKLGPYADSDTDSLNVKLHNLTDSLAKLKKEYEQIESIIQENISNKAILERQKLDLESKIANISALGSKCPYCENILTEGHIKKLEIERKNNLQSIINDLQKVENILKEKLNEKERLDSHISKQKDEITNIQNIVPLLQDYNDKIKEENQLKIKLDDLRSKASIPEEKSFPNDGRYKDALAYMKALKDAFIRFSNASEQKYEEEKRKIRAETDLKKIKKRQDIIKKKISDFQDKFDQLDERIKPLGDVDAILNKAVQAEGSVRRSTVKIKEDLSAKKKGLEHLNDGKQRISQEIKDSEEALIQYKKFTSCYDWLKEFFVPTLEQIEKQVLRSIQNNFNIVYQNWFSVLIDDPTKQSRIDEDFSPLVEQDGYEQDVDYLSGGEKTSIALAYRLTLNSMIRQETESLKSNLLILDEPTDGFSKAQLSKVKDVLQQLKSRQIILVSHEKELETYVENIFYITKDGGTSHVYRRNN